MRIRQLLVYLTLVCVVLSTRLAWRVITHRILHDPDGNKIVIVQQPPRS